MHLLRNELGKIDYIRDGINQTLHEVTNVDYLNNLVRDNLLATNKWNLKEEDKVLVNKMLMDFGENILVFLNASRNGHPSSPSDLNTANESSTPISGSIQLIKSLFSNFSLVDLKKFNFEIVFQFVSSRANSYLPLFKGFLSILYTFVFVILDSGFVVLGFLLNSVRFNC